MLSKHWDDKYRTSIYLGTALTGLGYIIAFFMGWITEIKPIFFLELVTVWVAYVCTLMFAFQYRMAYPIGILSTLLFSILFFLSGSTAMALFNLYLCLFLSYGYWFWKTDDDPAPVQHGITLKDYLIYPAISVIVYLILLGCAYLLGTTFAWPDVAIAVLSGVAQFGLDRKFKWNYVFWLIGNVLAVWYYYDIKLYLVSFQYFTFIGTSIYSFYLWHNTPVKEKIVSPLTL